MDTDAVRLFVMAADMLNISAAGKQLGLAPAVASARLSKLENQMGADLLHRSTRKVSLSLEGAEFLPFAREILAQEDAARAALGNGSSDITGTLRFAASSTFAQLYIAPILPEFLHRYPKINLDLKLSDTQMNLIEGGYDLALRNYAIEDSSLRARKLADDKRILCASPHYIEQHGMPEAPDDLKDHQILVFRNGNARPLMPYDSPTHSESKPSDSKPSGPKPSGQYPPEGMTGRIACDDGTSMRLATLAGVGISMSSMWSIHTEIKSGHLVRVLPDYEIIDQSAIWLVYPKSNVLSAKIRVFIDFLLEKIGRHPVWAD